jgi:hypothetical protein
MSIQEFFSTIRPSELVTNYIHNKPLKRNSKNKIFKLLFSHVEITDNNKRVVSVILEPIIKIIFRFILRVLRSEKKKKRKKKHKCFTPKKKLYFYSNFSLVNWQKLWITI